MSVDHHFGMTALSFVFALLAALLFAVSASLQQSSARTTALAAPKASSAAAAAVAFFRKLLRQPVWLGGLAVNVAGFCVHAVALRLGPIPVVQALLVMQLLFALPLAAWRRRIKLLRTDWIGTALVCGGLVVLVTRHLSHGDVRPASLPFGLIAVGGIIAVLVAVGAQIPRQRTQTRAALLGVAAGCCSATTAVLVVVATHDLPRLTWPLAGIVVSAALSGLVSQAAFASGSLPTALTSMTVSDPSVSYLATVMLFYGAAHPNPMVLALAATLVVAGVILLANSPTLHDERDAHAAVREVELAVD
jgi:drug/metabolite transporter (DMT)-like permease